jgi:2-polyprenyl-3-methyl-5-hydroxy-6-metoxy-1,4-benzoquinol methylase
VAAKKESLIARAGQMTTDGKSGVSGDWDANIHYQADDVAGRYDAERFSTLAGRVFNDRERRLVVGAFAGLSRGSRIADVPCGTGRLAEPLLAAGFRVHGMDISGQMLGVASRRLARFGATFTTEVADAKKLSAGAGTFDGVLCARVLMHFELPEQIEFLRGVAKLTRGIVVINHSYDSPFQRLRRKLKRLLGHQAPARHPISDRGIEALLEGAGLREIRRVRLNRLVSEAVYITAVPNAPGVRA